MAPKNKEELFTLSLAVEIKLIFCHSIILA